MIRKVVCPIVWSTITVNSDNLFVLFQVLDRRVSTAAISDLRDHLVVDIVEHDMGRPLIGRSTFDFPDSWLHNMLCGVLLIFSVRQENRRKFSVGQHYLHQGESASDCSFPFHFRNSNW